MELVKNVTVSFGAATDPMHFDQPWRIHWKPQAGPYPEFDGELTVRADETYKSALLELAGSYRPRVARSAPHSIGPRDTVSHGQRRKNSLPALATKWSRAI